MRPDIKLGVVISTVVVFVAGSYFLYRANDEAPVSLASNDNSAVGDKPQTSDSKTAKTPTKNHTPTKAQHSPVSRAKTQPPNASHRASRRNSSPVNRSTSPARRSTQARQPNRKVASTPRQTPHRLTPRETGARRLQPKVVTPSTPLAKNTPRSTPVNQQPGLDGPAQQGKVAENTPKTGAGQPNDKPATTRQPVSLAARPPEHNATPPDNMYLGQPVETHRVQPGDTFTSLAEHYYGDPNQAQFLIQSNPHLGTSGRIVTGQIVKIPPLPASATTGSRLSTSKSAASSKTTIAGRTYKVQPGDSFYKIAAKELGNASRWNELFELNKDLVKGDPKKLRVGAEIRLPAK